MANTTRPMRSVGRRRTKSRMTTLAASRRLGSRSVSAIDPDRSRVMTMSMPSTSMSSSGRLVCGRASTTPSSTTTSRRSTTGRSASRLTSPRLRGRQLARARVHQHRPPPRPPADPGVQHQRHRQRDQRQRAPGGRSGGWAARAGTTGRPPAPARTPRRSGRRGCARAAFTAARLQPGLAAPPPGWSGGRGRVDSTMRMAVSSAPRASPGGGCSLANFTRSQLASQPAISPRPARAAPAAQLRPPAPRWSSPAPGSRSAPPGTRAAPRTAGNRSACMSASGPNPVRAR